MKVRDIFALPEVDGDLGVEIELEMGSIDNYETILRRVPKGWRLERDGSLRDNGVELVLREPQDYETAMKALANVNKVLDDNNIVVDDSGRAGVHVHINMQEQSIIEVFNLVCLYLIFEDSLMDMCGEWRSGNLFCLRARDAEGMVSLLRDTVKKQKWGNLGSDQLRYAALNLNALRRYGSVEFRAMRSTTDESVLGPWMLSLLALREAATKFDDPVDVVTSYSTMGPDKLHELVFGDLPVILNPESMLDGMSHAQFIAFATEWANIKNVDYDRKYIMLRHEYQRAQLRGVEFPHKMLAQLNTIMKMERYELPAYISYEELVEFLSTVSEFIDSEIEKMAEEEDEELEEDDWDAEEYEPFRVAPPEEVLHPYRRRRQED